MMCIDFTDVPTYMPGLMRKDPRTIDSSRPGFSLYCTSTVKKKPSQTENSIRQRIKERKKRNTLLTLEPPITDTPRGSSGIGQLHVRENIQTDIHYVPLGQQICFLSRFSTPPTFLGREMKRGRCLEIICCGPVVKLG